MNPSGPCFESGPRGCFSFEEAFTPQKKLKLLGVFSGAYEQLSVFDAAGRIWRVKELRSRYKKSWWLSVLVHSVFNPWVDVEFAWHEPQAYALDDLKSRYAEAVDADDDILTQFVEPEELKKKIAEADSFNDLAVVYRWAKHMHQ